MKYFLLGIIGVSLCFSAVSAQKVFIVNTGIGHINLIVSLSEDGVVSYSVAYKNKPVIASSSLGFEFENQKQLAAGFKLISIDSSTKDETWKPVWGEQSSIRDHHKEVRISLVQQQADSLRLIIIFRVFADGVAFRYEFPNQPNLKYFIVSKELTQFQLTGDHKTFWIPGDYDSNEYPYTTSPISAIDAKTIAENQTDIAVRTLVDPYSVQTPLMMKSKDGLYINIHEAALENYSAMQLHVDRDKLLLTAALVPDAVGNKAYLKAPCVTPWRTIIVSDKATDILASKMILNLNEPSKIAETSWIKPAKFVGVWWEMQTGKGTWSYADNADAIDASGKLIPSGKHSANTENVKKYIDFAARHGIQGVLVEGWNKGWEDWFGNWKENVFDFVTPYPDFDVDGIQAYAKSKGVEMIMHNETSGSATNYERYMDTAFRFMNDHGYHSVKTGYVGKIIPRGEHHDGQWMVNHYLRAAEKAAQYKVMIDMHESVRPTGLQRTWPNWMANEAARGNEFNAFSIGSPPEHETILPFTRLLGGPMDYTPGIFKLKGYSASRPELQLHTTLAKQLALYVTMYSPLQMVADIPANYEAKADAFRFIEDVPVDWDDSRIIEAEPGDYISIARKEKGQSNWFVGAITDENGRTTNIPLDFLEPGKKYTAILYKDAVDADWKTNPEAYAIERREVTSKTILKEKLANGGGLAVSIMQADRKP